MSITDANIIAGCKDNDRKSQRLLLDRYARYLMGVIKRYCSDKMLAEDILQESWIQIFKSIGGYEDRGLLKAWLAKIAISQCYREIRKSNLIDFVEMTPEDLDIDPNAIDMLNYEDLIKVVNKLQSPLRAIFVMNVIDGLSHKEIGEIMNIKDSTSRAHLTKARKKLKALLQFTSITI